MAVAERDGAKDVYFEKWRAFPGAVTLFHRAPKPEHCGFHEHNSHRISFLVEGNIIEVNDRRQAVDTQELSVVYTPPGMVHAHRIQSPSVTCLCADIDPAMIKLADCEAVMQTPVLLKSGPAITTMLRIQREILAVDSASDLVLRALFLQFLNDLKQVRERRSACDSPAWLGRAIELLRDRCLENVSIEEISREVGVDPSHLARVFRQRLHETPGEFLRKQRLAWAAREIVRSDKPLELIASESGYSDQAHFNRHFKAQVGIAPGRFRRSLRWVSCR